MWYLVSCNSSRNLADPSSTGAISGDACNHPMSSEDPFKVLRTRDTILEKSQNEGHKQPKSLNTTITIKGNTSLQLQLNKFFYYLSKQMKNNFLSPLQTSMSTSLMITYTSPCFYCWSPSKFKERDRERQPTKRYKQLNCKFIEYHIENVKQSHDQT